MRAIGTKATGLLILLMVVASPTDAQMQQSVSQAQTKPRQQLNPAAVPAAKARLTKRFHQLSNQYGALKTESAKNAYATSANTTLRQTQSEIISTMRRN